VTEKPTWIAVVAVALEDSEGRILMQRRPLGKAHGGMWEFPGGKVEPDETPRAALVREVNEELALALDPTALTPACFADGRREDGKKTIVILLYSSRTWFGVPRSLEGGECGWFTRAEIAQLAMPPLDYELLERLP
jgi:8-oxo-dGTP diphosphatase